jgi:hypothetical protein
VVDIGVEGGARQQRTKGGFATKREAVAAMNELQESVVRGTYVRPSKLSVSEYLKDWLDTARLRLRPGAYDACELHVRAYITPRIGEVPLQALTSSKVKALYAELRQSGRARGGGPLSAKTVHNIHRTLSRALGDAVTDRLIASNPAAGQHRQPESPEMPTWSAEQLRGFLHFVADDPYAALWRLAATTGLRRGSWPACAGATSTSTPVGSWSPSSGPRVAGRSRPARRRPAAAADWSPSTSAPSKPCGSTAKSSSRSGSCSARPSRTTTWCSA